MIESGLEIQNNGIAGAETMQYPNRIGERTLAKQIVVLGAGYAGLAAAMEARKLLTAEAAQITIVNRHPFHQIVTELHQPAAGNASVKHVRLPLKKLLLGRRIGMVIAEIERIDLEGHQVVMKDGTTLGYDYLVVALGSETEYFGIPGLAEHSFTLKSIDDANRIHDHIENCFEQYNQTKDASLLTFIVGGGGLTGIELVGELADAMPRLTAQYGVSKEAVKLYCVEAMPTILPGFPETLINRAKSSLEARGVTFLTGVPVVKAEAGKVYLKEDKEIPTQTVIWSGGVRGHAVVENSGLECERRGRAYVNEFMQAKGHDHVFVIGDSCIYFNEADGRPYPPTAQISSQMGANAASNIHQLMKGGHLELFHPHLQGTLASLGRKDAIGMVGKRKFEVKGTIAGWLKEGSNMRYLMGINGLFKRA